MQITNMKVLTSIFLLQKSFFYLANLKTYSKPSLISFRSRQNTQISRAFHSTRIQFSAQESSFPANSSEGHTRSSTKSSKARQVWTTYDPITGTVVTQRAASNDGGMVSEQSTEGEKQPSASKWEDGIGERRYGDVQNVKNEALFLGKKKKGKGKGKTSYVCSNCGHSSGQWWAKCMQCYTFNSMVRFHEGDTSKESRVGGFDASLRSWLPQHVNQSGPLRLKDVQKGINMQDWRIPLAGLLGDEIARVLGGGLVPGSLVLVGGDPGVGKSTLLLQIAELLAEGSENGQHAPVVYISGEESVQQIGNRADRLEIETDDLYIYSSTDIEDILEQIKPLSPRALIIDSVQTVYLKGVVGSAGGPAQVKECTSALLQFAKKTNIPVLLIGHVTKSGDIAGPHVLEHIVDVVLYMEGEKSSSHRLLRSVKNRFGSTDELGVFEMTQSGLQAVSNPSEMFLSEHHCDSDVLAGLAVAVIMDGSRSFVIEIQALCVSSSTISRQVSGIQQSRANIIIAVLMKQAGLHLQENAIFLNIVSGVTLTETAGDLAIAAAICSSFLEFPIPGNIAFIGEIGLSGELRTVPRMEKRVMTVAKLGYKMCIIPKAAAKSLESREFVGLELIGCRSLKEVINTVFTNHK